MNDITRPGFTIAPTGVWVESFVDDVPTLQKMLHDTYTCHMKDVERIRKARRQRDAALALVEQWKEACLSANRLANNQHTQIQAALDLLNRPPQEFAK